MSTSAIPAISSVYSSAYASGSDRVPTKELTQDDFLKLLVAQMTSQDPLSPSSDLSSMTQMASFTALEQTRALRGDVDLLRANTLIGRTVEIDFRDPQTGLQLHDSGVVTAVQMEEGTPKIVVNGMVYDMDDITQVTARPTTGEPQP